MNNSILYIMLAITAGVLIPFQSAMNSALGKGLQNPYFSALTIFIVAVIGLSAYIVLSRQTVPNMTHFAAPPKWSYIGGLLGGTYVLLVVWLAPKLGIGNVTVLVLMGQVIAAMVIDQFGLLGAPLHPITWQRLIGVVLLCTGVYMIRKF